MQSLKKIRQKIFETESGNEFLTSIKGHNLFDGICPSTIPSDSFLISTLIQSLKKIGQKMLKIESGNEALTDGLTQTDRWTDERKDGHLNANF